METLGRMRIKLFVLAALKEHNLRVSFVIPLFVYLRCAVLVSVVHYGLCSVTVLRNVLQNGRLVSLTNKTACWCAFSWSFCNQNGHFVRSIQSNSSQGCDGTHRSWEDVISSETEWLKTKTE